MGDIDQAVNMVKRKVVEEDKISKRHSPVLRVQPVANRSVPLPVLSHQARLSHSMANHQARLPHSRTPHYNAPSDIAWLNGHIIPTGAVNSKLATYPTPTPAPKMATYPTSQKMTSYPQPHKLPTCSTTTIQSNPKMSSYPAPPYGVQTLPRPNSAVSNRGLVIVQVQNSYQGPPPAYDSILRCEPIEKIPTPVQDCFVTSEEMNEASSSDSTVNSFSEVSCQKSSLQFSEPSNVKSSVQYSEASNVKSSLPYSDVPKIVVSPPQGKYREEADSSPASPPPPNYTVTSSTQRVSSSSSESLPQGSHQLIHGFPPNTFLPEGAEEEEEEGEDEVEDPDDDPDYSAVDEADEGYRTNSSTSSGSPSMSSVESPPPAQETTAVPTVVRNKRKGNPRECEEDGEGNLMWLLDFKLDFFNDVDKQTGERRDKKAIQLEKTDRGEKRQRLEDDHQLESRPEHQHAPITRVVTPPTLEPRPLADQPLEQGEGASDQKPPYTYTDLITLALKEKVALTVSGIYQWITERYPYFKAEDDRWKNSVRHNLSMNPHFRKGSKSKNGAGHNWVLADEYQDALKCQFAPVKVISTEDEAAAAVRSILATPSGGLSAPPGGLSAPSGGVAAPQGGEEAGLDKESVVKRAWSSILSVEDGGVAKEGGSRLPRPALPDPVLQKSAEDILAGVKRQAKVEVQYLVQDKENDSWRPSLGPPCKKPLLVMEDPSVAHMSVLPVHNGLDLSSPPLHLVPAIVPHSVPSHQAHHTMGHPSHQVTSVPFCPIDQIPELDVPVYSYQYSDYANIDYNDVDGLEKALGIDFQGVVQRELLAK